MSNRNPAVIEDIEVEILEPNPESIKIDEVEGQFIDDNQVKINYEFDREVYKIYSLNQYAFHRNN